MGCASIIQVVGAFLDINSFWGMQKYCSINTDLFKMVAEGMKEGSKQCSLIGVACTAACKQEYK